MKGAPTPDDESTRIATLKALDILDIPPHENFDRITRLAKPLFNVPIALVSLVDTERQWFLSRYGLEVKETPRDVSFCGHAINYDDIFVVNDAHKNPDFRDNPLVTGNPNVRFYAGCPVYSANKVKLGTLCLIDSNPREFSEQDRSVLKNLAQLVERELAGFDLSSTDAFTGLPNFRGFVSLAAPISLRADEAGPGNVLVALHLSSLKQVNTKLGRDKGDSLLISFAEFLSNQQQITHVVARIESSHFALLLENITVDEAEIQVTKLIDSAKAALKVALASDAFDLDFDFGCTAMQKDKNSNFKVTYSKARRQYDTAYPEIK